MIDTDGFKKSPQDMAAERRIYNHCRDFGIDPTGAVQHFPVLARRQALKRFLAHVELFKMTLDVPGDIAEVGVYHGLGLFTWANLLEAYCIGDRTKTVWGFDNFKGVKGDFIGDPAALQSAIDMFDADRFIPEKPRIKLWKGDISHTASDFVTQNKGVRFSLVHMDCDLYEPTLAGIEAFWGPLSVGGVMIFDEYGQPDWPGETEAVDNFFSGMFHRKLKTLPWTNTPGAYIVKE